MLRHPYWKNSITQVSSPGLCSKSQLFILGGLSCCCVIMCYVGKVTLLKSEILSHISSRFFNNSWKETALWVQVVSWHRFYPAVLYSALPIQALAKIWSTLDMYNRELVKFQKIQKLIKVTQENGGTTREKFIYRKGARSCFWSTRLQFSFGEDSRNLAHNQSHWLWKDIHKNTLWLSTSGTQDAMQTL